MPCKRHFSFLCELCDNLGVKISAAIITFNEAHNISGAIDSLAWADEIVVVDSESTDQTREIAADLGAKVVVRAWEGFASQKQYATELAANDWVFSLDADERVSEELRDEIRLLKNGAPQADGYRMPRRSIYMNRPIRHSGWYPDRQLRLFDRRKGKWNDRRIHESFSMVTDAAIADLRGDLIHYSVESAAHHHRMIGERYAPLAAEQMFADGRTTSLLGVASAGPGAFLRSYILKLGLLDGLPGFVIASFSAHHAFLKHLMLWEMKTRGIERKQP